MEIIKKINEHLQDEHSKRIFANRIMFNNTNDYEYIKQIIYDSSLFREIEHIFSLVDSEKEKYIAGVGYWGKVFFEVLKTRYNFNGFIDNNVCGKYKNLPIVTTKEFGQKCVNELVFVCSVNYHVELVNDLISNGICKENIVDLSEILLSTYYNNQYFDLEDLPHVKDEVFVDCGCYNGMNSVGFAKWAGNDAKKVYAFEPDSCNIEKCKEVFSQVGFKYELYNMGAWSNKGVLHFSNTENESSRISQDGDNKIAVSSIDLTIDDRITFIKMDIEGAELKALEGAQNHIRNDKPKLAVSVYHKSEDIIKIPEYILSLNPEYKLFLRHYSVGAEETVLYAI